MSGFKPRPLKLKLPALVAIGVAAVLVIWWLGRAVTSDRLPNFSQYERVDEKKEAFFTYLAEHVDEANAVILADRERLLEIREDLDPGDEPGYFDAKWVHEKLAQYEFDPVEKITDETLRLLAQRMDIIPPSLVLAQAAVESAWGTSRFAREGNNLFGMRTYEPGTGIVPKRRPAGATWEVAAYDTVTGGLAAYIHNLNTHDPYLRLRIARASLRNKGATIRGGALVDGLRSYSEQGYEYVAKIRGMIRSNDLEKYDG
ncbi:MAG: glucosaminidase domain-containing protein [Synoicihabitans sp.]